MSQFETFLKLHNGDSPVLIGNSWDAGSAKLLEENGFKAIATSSLAVALSMGYEDGENIPFELLFEIAKRIKKNISVPFSVDMERGYGNSAQQVIQNIERLYDIGVVGINIEDSSPVNGELLSAGIFAKTLSSIANHLSQKHMDMYINARTDAFLLGLPDALTETHKRIVLYDEAGASGIFVPFVKAAADIKAVCDVTRLPVNVLSMPQLPGIAELAALGVRRLSLGSSLYRSVNKEMVNKIHAIQVSQSVQPLF